MGTNYRGKATTTTTKTKGDDSMKTYRIELIKNGRVIYRNYVDAYLVETAILAAGAVAVAHNITGCTARVTDGRLVYENDY